VTLIQTGRMARIPILLFGVEFWRRIINLEALSEFGTIAPEDVELLHFVDNADEAFQVIRTFYREDPA
jgi:predicted Rossmann-fold nucleotide-binding protein